MLFFAGLKPGRGSLQRFFGFVALMMPIFLICCLSPYLPTGPLEFSTWGPWTRCPSVLVFPGGHRPGHRARALTWRAALEARGAVLHGAQIPFHLATPSASLLCEVLLATACFSILGLFLHFGHRKVSAQVKGSTPLHTRQLDTPDCSWIWKSG